MMQQSPHSPTIDELPTTQQLNRATLIAAGIAAILLVTVVMPSEYGIDPLGTGRLVGLTAMGESKGLDVAQVQEVESGGELLLDEPSAADGNVALSAGANEVRLTLQPDEGREVKATMLAGQALKFEWSAADNAQVNWELHGEEIGAPGNEYTSYEKGVSAGESGTFRAPFDGTHGWFWRNRTSTPAIITVRADGDFSKFELVPEK